MRIEKDDDDTPVKVWTFEQWQAGIAPPFFGTVLSWTGKPMMHEIAIEDYSQVLAEQKRCYDAEVKRRTEAKVKYWQKSLVLSRDKEALLKAEVNRVHDMLHRPENWQQRRNVHYNTYWSEYTEVIVNASVKPHIQFHPYHDGRAGAEHGRADSRQAIRYAECEALHEYLNYLKAENAGQVVLGKVTETSEVLQLKDLITHERSIDIVAGIKTQYKGIRGKRLKLLLLVLQELKLLPPERISKRFHECCKTEFEWSVASYNAMNGYDYNDGIDNKDSNEMKRQITKWMNQKKPLV